MLKYQTGLFLNMYGVFPICLGRTHLLFWQQTTFSLLLFCFFMLYMVWNEQLVTSSQRMQLFRKPNNRPCFFFSSWIRHGLKEVCEKSMWLEGKLLKNQTISVFKTLSVPSIHFIKLAMYLQEVTLWGWKLPLHITTLSILDVPL